jgi:hypothetical protein
MTYLSVKELGVRVSCQQPEDCMSTWRREWDLNPCSPKDYWISSLFLAWEVQRVTTLPSLIEALSILGNGCSRRLRPFLGGSLLKTFFF